MHILFTRICEGVFLLNKKANVKLGEEGRGVLKGIIAFFVTAGTLLLVGAFFITWKDINEMITTVITYAITAIASLIGGWVGGKSVGKFGFKVGTYIGGIGAFMLLLAGVITNGMGVTILTIIRILVCLLFGCIGGIVGTNVSLKHKFKI